MNHVAVRHIFSGFEVRNFQGTHSLDGQSHGLVGAPWRVRLAQALSCRSQGAEHLRPIKSLTFTVVAEAHMVVPHACRQADSTLQLTKSGLLASRRRYRLAFVRHPGAG